MTNLRNVLSVNMKHHRKRLDLSQAKLAELVDASDNYIALIETGRRFPSLSMLEQLAIALQIDILELFSLKAIELSAKKDQKNIILSEIDHILNLRLIDEPPQTR